MTQAGFVGSGDLHRRSTGIRNREKGAVPGGRKYNCAFLAPRCAASIHCVADGLDRAAGESNLLEFSWREKPHVGAIGRPEWVSRFLCALNRLHRQRVERAEIKLLLAALAHCGQHQLLSIRRESNCRVNGIQPQF